MFFAPVKTRSGLWVIKNRNPELPHFPNSTVSVQKRKDEARGFPPTARSAGNRSDKSGILRFLVVGEKISG
jgi:hypothetical protein